MSSRISITTPKISVIEIGSQEFMCVGANPPFDHPHVFLDLGNDNEIICPYCSTLYRFSADLAAGEARPAGMCPEGQGRLTFRWLPHAPSSLLVPGSGD